MENKNRQTDSQFSDSKEVFPFGDDSLKTSKENESVSEGNILSQDEEKQSNILSPKFCYSNLRHAGLLVSVAEKNDFPKITEESQENFEENK
jgi:hypothetical protein